MKSQKKVSRQPQVKPTKLTLTDRLKIVMGFVGALGLPALMLHFACIQGQKSSIFKTVEKWRSDYGITTEQASVIRGIEFDYHGSGSPFSMTIQRSNQDRNGHYQEIARHIPDESRNRFLDEMKKGCE